MRLLELIVSVDDFCQIFPSIWEKKLIADGRKKRCRTGKLSVSEITPALAEGSSVTIIISNCHWQSVGWRNELSNVGAWQAGLSKRVILAEKLPPLQMLLIWDNLQVHYTPDMVLWLFHHGLMPLYTPLGGFWLNMTESIQRIIFRSALNGQNPETPEQIMVWLEALARGSNTIWHDLSGVVVQGLPALCIVELNVMPLAVPERASVVQFD